MALQRHAVVAVGVGRRHAALVHPVDFQLVPGHARAPGLCGVGQGLEDRLGGAAAADGDARPPALGHRRFNPLDKIPRGALRERGSVRLNFVDDLEILRHGEKPSEFYVTRIGAMVL